MELCFFFNMEEGMVELITMLWLSQNKLAGPTKGIPSILRSLRRAIIISVAILIAMNSDP